MENDHRKELLGSIFGAVQAKALAMMAELGIAKYLGQQSLSIEQLAGKTCTHQATLQRLLALLKEMGLVRENNDGTFENTVAGAMLQAGHEGSFAHYALLTNSDVVLNMLAHMRESLISGQSVFEKQHGVSFYQGLQQQPDLAAVFNGAMAEISAQDIPETLAVFDPGQAKSIIDIGGGEGHLLAALLDKYPAMSGALLELPDVAEQAQTSLAPATEEDRCQIYAGDFLQNVPARADIFLLKRVLSHCSDSDARKLLSSIRQVMNNDDRLLIIDPDTDTLYGASYNLLMVSVVGATGVRTENELRDLFNETGFNYVEKNLLETELCVVEARPA